MFLGGSIHEVAQVVGAGYSMSRETGDVATVVKLMRVAMLLPVIICAAMITRAQRQTVRPVRVRRCCRGLRSRSWSWLQSTASVGSARACRASATELSRACLAIAMSAIGMNTQLKEILAVGFKPIALMIGEAVFLAGLVLFAVLVAALSPEDRAVR